MSKVTEPRFWHEKVELVLRMDTKPHKQNSLHICLTISITERSF